jgi:acetyl esterase/lipase
MTRSLILGFLLTTISAGSIGASEFRFLPRPAADLAQARLVLEGSNSPPAEATPDASRSCEGVTFTRNLKYRDNDQTVLDVATADVQAAVTRPVLLFVAGETFAGENGIPDFTGPLQDAAMCFAARNGMVGVRMAYQLAPANPWPGGARDVATAISWIRDNIDLFQGNPQQIVAIGYSVGASHVASYLSHPELQVRGHGVAGVVLVSGIYRADPDASDAEKAYFGDDASKYEERSAFPGISRIEMPMMLAWSVLDPPRLIVQGEKLKDFLCNIPAHCPRTRLLDNREGLSSVFALDVPGDSLAEPTLELVRIIEARGLP